MKNLFVIAALAGMFALVSCGGGKKDDEQAKKDSARKADSIAKVKEDSIKKAEDLEQARLDSLKQDSIDKAEKKTTPTGNYKPTNNTTTTTTTTTTGTKPNRGGAVKTN